MLTAASTVEDRVDGLGLGADDYLPKPFDFAELVARDPGAGPPRPARRCRPLLSHGDLRLDPGRRRRHPGRAAAGRSARRSSPCWSACSPPRGRVVSAEELLERVWDEAADPFTTTVKTTI